MKRIKLITLFLATGMLSLGVSVSASAKTFTGVTAIDNPTVAGEKFTNMGGMAYDANGVLYVLKSSREDDENNVIGRIAGNTLAWFRGSLDCLDKKDLGHGNDMAYNFVDKKMYVAPSGQKFLQSFVLNNNPKNPKLKVESLLSNRIAMPFTVGGVAYSKTYNKFVTKGDGLGNIHIGSITNNVYTEEANFKYEVVAYNGVNKDGIDNSFRPNQGITLKDGYLYLVFYDKSNKESYIYKSVKAINKWSTDGKILVKRYASLKRNDKKLIAAVKQLWPNTPANTALVQFEVESLQFNKGVLHCVANVQYKKSSDGSTVSADGVYTVKP